MQAPRNNDETGNKCESLVLIGGGGHALVIAESAKRMGFHLPGFLDDQAMPALASEPEALMVLGGMADLGRIAGRRWILAIGNLSLRRSVLEALASVGEGGNATSVIHPGALVSSTARIGKGVFVGPGAIINARAVINDHAIINSGVIVEHECIVGQNTHLAPGVVLAGGVRIGGDTLIGAGSRVLPTLSVGSDCTIGAGSVVLRSVPDQCTAMGVPAKIVRKFDDGIVAPESLIRNS